MKAFPTLILVLTFGALTQANTQTYVKTNSIEMGFVLDNSADHAESPSKIAVSSESGVARLYKFQNARVKKALSFTTRPSKQHWA